MKDYVYRRTVAELQERSCELKRRQTQPAEPDYRATLDTAPTAAILYRIYTEDRQNLSEIVGRYFGGFTILAAYGVYEGINESSAVIEIIASRETLQTIVHLAGDIKHRNAQSSVLVTWQNVSRLDV